MNAEQRPVQLQANVAGAWKTVLLFDAGDDQAATNVQVGVAQLYEAAPATSWRITTRDRVPVALRHLGRNTYGLWVDRPHH